MKTGKKAIATLLLIILLFSNSIIVSAYNPFTPDYDEGGAPDTGISVHLSAENADFILTGKKAGAELRDNIDFTDTMGHWAKEHVFKMAAQSVVRGYGSRRFSPGGSVSRQEALAMLVRIMGREAEVQRRAAAGGASPTGSGIFDLWAREYITLAQDVGILDIGEGGSWDTSATREEVAVWLARALRVIPVYGSEQQYLYNLHDWQRINIQNQPFIEAILRDDIMKGDDRGYFNPNSGLRRSEMAVMLDRVADRFYSLRNITAYSGRVIQKGTLDGVPALSIQNTDGTYSLVILSENTDFPVFRNGVVGLGNNLQTDDRVDYVTDEEGVLYALVPEGGGADVIPNVIEGYIRAVDPASYRLSITDYDGNVYTYRYADNTGVIINSRPAGVKDLKFGLEAVFTLKGDMVSMVESSYSLEQPGYISSPGRVRSGKVVKSDSGSLLLDLDNGGREEFSITYGTIIAKEGNAVPPGSIRVGDRIRVYTDTVYSTSASRIEIEGMQQLIQDIYKGTLSEVHPSGGTLTLKETFAFVNGDWEERERRTTFELGPEAQIYYGGRVIESGDIQSNFLNTDVYVAVHNNFGNRRVVKAVLKMGSEQFYNGRIDDMSWGTGEIKLRDRSNIILKESAIILSEGRMVDISALDKDSTVTVVANRYDGLNNAAVVMLEDVRISGDEIYVGRLNEIRTREFDINYYSSFEQNQWDRVSSRSRNLIFDYDRDTYIIEVIGSRVKVLNAADFFQGDYADKYTSKHRDDYYAYVVADGDRARAIRITKEGVVKDGSAIDNANLEELRATTGEVSGIDTAMGILTINKANNWSGFHEQWERSDSDNYINYAGALILRDGRVIDAGELRRGEGVYIIGDDNRGIIIMAH